MLQWGDHYQFKDSLQFLNSSLEKLAESLAASSAVPDHFEHLNEAARLMGWTADQLKLLKQKGIFPYDWFDSFDKIDETALPPREAFDSTLRNEKCSVEDYERAHKVWNEFNLISFYDYIALYLCSMLLFLHFISLSLS